MTRRITGLCVASVCSCVISLGAQSSTSSATVQRSGANDAAGHDVTVTGCVAKAADGRFMLTNATVEPMGMASTAGTSGTTSGTTAGSTAGTATAGATTPRPGSGSTAAADTMSWMLSGGSDLDKHVGHKIQVTGRTTWDSSMNRSMSSGSTAGTTTGTTGTTAGGSTAGATTAGSASSTMANHPMVDVKTVKMISSSCS